MYEGITEEERLSRFFDEPELIQYLSKPSGISKCIDSSNPDLSRGNNVKLIIVEIKNDSRLHLI